MSTWYSLALVVTPASLVIPPHGKNIIAGGHARGV
jgi:hypothetical protein